MKLIFFTQTLLSRRRTLWASPEHIYFENGQPDQEKSRKNVAKRPFFGQNLRSEYGYLRPREASVRGHFGAQKSCHRVRNTLGTCGAGQVALVRSNPPPVAVPSPQNRQKNCRNFGPAVQPAATLWQVCGVMPATPEAIKSTTDAAGHAGENRNAFIGFEMDFPALTLSPSLLAETRS